MLNYEKALSYALVGDAVFFFGAGFSVCANNLLNERLMSGKKLAEELSRIVGLDKDIPLDIVSQEYIDQIGERSLCKYLKNHYEVSDYNDCYDALSKIKELKVYTTNYDDLVEKICQKNKKGIKSYSLTEKVNKCDKKNMVMHLNGSVKDLIDNIPNTFNLTHLSYNNSPLYNSPWYPFIKDEIRCAKAVFIIGLSFKSDLDLRRLISCDQEITEKCFIIETSNLTDNDKNYLSKYGHVMLNGIEGFCSDLNSAQPEKENYNISNYKFKSFKEIKRNKTYKDLTDRSMFEFLFFGKIEKNLFYLDEDEKFSYLVNRDKLIEAIETLKSGKSIIIHSDLGNGKTIFLNQLLHKLPGNQVFLIQPSQNYRFLKEVEILCESNKKTIIVIDPYNLYLDDLQKFKNYNLCNIQFILISRTAMHDNCCEILYDIIDQMQGIEFSSNPFNLNKLSPNEAVELAKLIDRYGFWGEKASSSIDEKITLISGKLDGRFQNVLLYLFNDGQIKGKLEMILKEIIQEEIVTKILILSFVNEVLELNLDREDFNIVFECDNIDRILRRRKEILGEFLDYNTEQLHVKSSIISKALIGSSVIPKTHLLSTLLTVTNRLDYLYDGNRKYHNALKNLASASYLSFIFDYNLESKILIEYYENIKENRFNKNNLFFWEQYAITCVNIKDFFRAKKYFETSYSLAKKKDRHFSTFQIDNHYARFLLEGQIYSRDYDTAFSTFIKAHQLLIKKYIGDEMINDRFYQFRVAIVYKEYFDIFYKHFTQEEKDAFIKRCKEIYDNLKSYIKNSKHQDYRNYIYDCQDNLEYIFNCVGFPVVN